MRAAKIKVPFCMGCISVLEDYSTVLVDLPVQAGDVEYSSVCIDLCHSCLEEEDYNKVRKNLNYWLMESPAYKIA
jgi:hypothetical protein